MTSKPEAVGGAPLPDRVRLLVDLGACLAAWQQALAHGARPADPNLSGLRRVSSDLQPRLRAVGFGGIAHHLGALIARVDAGGAAGDVREPLGALSELSEQAKSSLPANEQAQLAQAGRTPPERAIAQAAPAAPAPPPMITVGGERRVSAVAGEAGRWEPGAVTSVAAKSAEPPRMLDSQILQSPADRPGKLPSIERPGAGLPGHEPDPPRPVVAPPVAGPSDDTLAVAGLARAGDQAGAMAPVQTPSRPLGAAVAAPAKKPPNAPNLQVRPMLGLRAFGARKPKPGSGSVPAVAAAKVDERQDSLLGLKRKASSSGSRGSSSAPPPLLDRSPSGLPPLPPVATPGPRSASSPAVADGASGATKVRDLFGGIGRARSVRRGGQAPVQPALLRYRQQGSQGWRVGAIALAVLVLVLGGLATLVVVLTRRDEAARRAEGTPAAASDASAQGPAATSGELPRARLLSENEAFRALLAQVHGRGKESPELRALVDEEAALAARTVSQRKCEGSSAACQEWEKIRASVLSQQGVKRVTRRRAAGSPDRIRSSWMVGLKLPEIPIEDDPRVQRWFEYYSEGTVGRELLQGMLFRCGAYRDLIEATLIRYGLPKDLLAIVFIESGCEPQATSPVGAAGLWQFMPATARAYHLRVKEGIIDERRSPPKSTEGAIRFLRDLRDKLQVYQKQRVWDLVFGSYNMGPFGMVARIEGAGGDVGFWDLVDADRLPDETAQYTPAVQAIALILNNLQRLKFAGVQMRSPQLTSDLTVPPGTRLSLVARAAATSVNRLRSLNLDISGDRTPDVPNFAVQVPKDVVWQARDTLKELTASGDRSDQCMPPGFDWGRQRFTKKMAAACRRKLGASTPPPKR